MSNGPSLCAAPLALAVAFGSALLVPVTAAAQDAVTILMHEEDIFEPAAVTIRVGDTVHWINMADHGHAVSFDPAKAAEPGHIVLPDGAEPFASDEIVPDKGWRHTFQVPGLYHYVCWFHGETGMVGTITVEE